MPVDRRSPIPYYLQVKEQLRERIRAEEWRPGMQLPGEAELCQIYNVSRTVIRQALGEMMHEGQIVREKGRGTFVAEPKIAESLAQKLTGFYQDMINQGYTPITQVFRQKQTPASAKIAQFLHLEPGTPVIEIERLRSIQAEPIVWVTTYLPYSLCPALLDEDLANQSLYAFLEKKCGLFITRGRRTIEAVAATEYEAYLLNVPKGAPLIMLDSVSYLKDGTPIEYFHALHRGDRSKFEVELVRVHESERLTDVLTQESSDLPRSN